MDMRILERPPIGPVANPWNCPATLMTDQGHQFQGPSRGGYGSYSSYESGHRGGHPFKRQRFDNREHRGGHRGRRGNFRGRRGTYPAHNNREGYASGGNPDYRGDPSDIVFDIGNALSNPWKDLEDELGLDHCQVDIIERTGTSIEISPPGASPEPESSLAHSVGVDMSVGDEPDVDMAQDEVLNADEISIDIDGDITVR
ncbi:hypothetical protein V1522DRAFT_453084 [Lipomyces starkeyi]